MDTGFDRYSDNVWHVYSDERKWINKILALAEQYPDDVRITNYPDENGGVLTALLPAKWFRVMPPRRLKEKTPEEKAALAARLKAGREKKKDETV